MNINDYAFGIDISQYQCYTDGSKKINFDCLKQHDPKISFIIARATVSWGYKDTRFDWYWQEMQRIGVCRAAYHFAYPSQDYKRQANWFLTTVDPQEHDRLAIDLENAQGVGKIAMTDFANAMILYLQECTGKRPILYSRKQWLEDYLYPDRLVPVDLWLAQYANVQGAYAPEKTPPPDLPKGFSTWLIHQTGGYCQPFCKAASKVLDYDRWNGSEADVKAYFGYVEQPEPPTPPEPPQPPAEEFPKMGIVIADPSVNIRKEPSIQSADIGDFVKGANLNIIGEQGDFWQVSAWVAKQWVQVNEPYEPPEGAMAILPLSQRDPRWANDKMGNSSCTVGRFGCLITSITMALRWFGKDIDVKELNRWLSANGGYVNGTGNLYWGAIPELYSDIYMHTSINCVSIPAPLDKIDALLAQNIPVIVEVDFNPATTPIDQHWVLLIGKQGDDYIVNDPWYGDTGSFKQRYGLPSRYIFWIRAYAKRA
jgi:GH25 family lysozyme M1 (1,4-beta-N-acetylmuramidase)